MVDSIMLDEKRVLAPLHRAPPEVSMGSTVLYMVSRFKLCAAASRNHRSRVERDEQTMLNESVRRSS